MDESVELYELLPPEASSASRARALVRRALDSAGPDPDEWAEEAQLAVSEVVTNALVHSGTPIGVRVRVTDGGLRVEVTDGNPHHPSAREYATLAGTGRGLTLLEESVDGWGVEPMPGGKTVWFELRSAGSAPYAHAPAGAAAGAGPVGDAGPLAVDALVELRNVPLLMHAAWQEHAAALLRDFLLVQLDEDPDAIERHAQASDALHVLFEQIPSPDLGDDPEALMAAAVEPAVSLPVATLTVPHRSIPHFAALDQLLDRAVAAADRGHLLVPPTQPEVQEMRTWLCGQVRGQVLSGRAPQPWQARTDPREPVDLVEYADWDPAEVSGSARSLIATDERSVVVAASPSALAFLGYADASALVGRRVITIIPPRFRQAHIAGTTLHVVNGRDPLLGVRLRVPVLRADGTEALAELLVEKRQRTAGRRVYVGELSVAAHPRVAAEVP
ncbi:PAS domain S-box protein [Nocardioides guangzhouensis]|uniref:PAS domain S-box protein n=1 Tax=Nocardioides guangzhouensis TaxID=2497878 RepID=A0A4Q4ZKE8_9ACTN|nr:ATP-binding protein [Nocardioides guangzhouensis]RYP88345.1 PAS domain S-box protein [Nocardioides guangzhouensis]